MCKGTSADPEKLQKFLIQRLHNSSLDAAVDAMSDKAGGFFMYARLLQDQLNKTKRTQGPGGKLDFSAITAFPEGLDDMYAANFTRVFPGGVQGDDWLSCCDLVALIVAALEPLPLSMARRALGWSDAQQEMMLSATALLFPVRDGSFRVLHKSVVDYLLRVDKKNQPFEVRADQVQGAHTTLASACNQVLDDQTSTDIKVDWPYSLRHIIAHSCSAGTDADTERAVQLACDFSHLAARAELGPVTALLLDARRVRDRLKVDDTRHRVVKLVCSALQRVILLPFYAQSHIPLGANTPLLHRLRARCSKTGASCQARSWAG